MFTIASARILLGTSIIINIKCDVSYTSQPIYSIKDVYLCRDTSDILVFDTCSINKT